MARVQRVDPNWKPRQGMESIVEGLIGNLQDETEEAEDRLAQERLTSIPSPRGGHHWVPRAVSRHFSLSPETTQVFENAKSGTLEDDIVNLWKLPHRQYKNAIEEALKDFLAKNSITARQMTPEHAQRFLDQVFRSSDPRIRDFNVKVMEQRLKYLSRNASDLDDYDD
jgi:hypothetical protein